MSGACSTLGESRGVYRVLTGILEERRPLERPRLRWKNNIKMDFRMWDGGYGLDRSGSG